MARVPHVVHDAITDEDIKSLFPVYNELDEHIFSPEELLRMVKLMKSEGRAHFIYVKDTLEGESKPRVVSILSFIIRHSLFYYKQLHINDLCTFSAAKKKGYAGALVDRAIEIAKEEKCNSVTLASQFHRGIAHRMYANKGFYFSNHHFCLDIDNIEKKFLEQNKS